MSKFTEFGAKKLHKLYKMAQKKRSQEEEVSLALAQRNSRCFSFEFSSAPAHALPCMFAFRKNTRREMTLARKNLSGPSLLDPVGILPGRILHPRPTTLRATPLDPHHTRTTASPTTSPTRDTSPMTVRHCGDSFDNSQMRTGAVLI